MAMQQAQDQIDFDPPPGCPPYSVGVCRCKVVNLALREKVERASREIVLASKEEEKRLGGVVPDAWFRERLSAPDGPMMILHRHYAGMGGRPMMGKGVGGFALGAACPSGGLASVTTCTYDFQWFALLINRNLLSVMEAPENSGTMETFESKVPDCFTCWQLNFGKNESTEMSDMCFYNPHVDKNNAKVSSMGTSYGDYEGGGVWIAHPDGKTMVEFDADTSGVHPGLVPGHVLHQKVKWLTFWAATKVHAIPPFRKNRIGLVAFSSQTALRVTPEERKFLDALEFKMPHHGDVRFLPACPYLVRLKEDEVKNLSPEDLEKRDVQRDEYERDLREHQRECDKMAFELAEETMRLNKKRIICTVTRGPDGKNAIVTTRTRVVTERSIEEQNAADFSALEAEARAMSDLLDVQEKMSKEKKDSEVPEVEAKRIDALWRNLHKEFKLELIDYPIFDDESDDELSEPVESRGLDAKDANNEVQSANPAICDAPNTPGEAHVTDTTAPASEAHAARAEAPDVVTKSNDAEAVDTDMKSSDADDLETSEKDEPGGAGSTACPVSVTVELATEPRPADAVDTKDHATHVAHHGEPAPPHAPTCAHAPGRNADAAGESDPPAPDRSSRSEDTTHKDEVPTTALDTSAASAVGGAAASTSNGPQEPRADAWWTKGGDELVEVRVVLDNSRGAVVQNASGEPVFFDELENVHLFARSDAAMLSRTQRKNYEGRRWTQKLRYNVDPSKFDADHSNALARKQAEEANSRTNTSSSSQAENPHTKPANTRHPSPRPQAPLAHPTIQQVLPQGRAPSNTSAALVAAAHAAAGFSTSSSAPPPGSTAAALAHAALLAQASHLAHLEAQKRQRQLHVQAQRKGPVMVEIDDDEEDDLVVVKSTLRPPAVGASSSPFGLSSLFLGLPRQSTPAARPLASFSTSSTSSAGPLPRPAMPLLSPFRPRLQDPWSRAPLMGASVKRQAPHDDAANGAHSVAKKPCFGPSASVGYHQSGNRGVFPPRFGHPFMRPFLPGEVVCLDERKKEGPSAPGAVIVD